MPGNGNVDDDAKLRGRIAHARQFFPDIASLGGKPAFTHDEIERAIEDALPDRAAATHGNCARFAAAPNAAVGGPGHFVCASAGEFGPNHVAAVIGGRMYDGFGHLSAAVMVDRYIEIDRDLEGDEGGLSFEEWARLRLCDFLVVYDPDGREVRNWGDTDGDPFAFDVDEMADRLRLSLMDARQPRMP